MIKFWTTWKLKLIVGVAVLAALAIALFAAYQIGHGKGKNISKVAIEKYIGDKNKLQAELSQAQSRVNTRIITEYSDRIIYQDRIVYQNHDVIRNIVVPRPGNVTKGWVAAHDAAALGQPIDRELAANPEASGVSDNKVLETVADNYTIGQKAIIQLESLQKWIKETWEAKDEVTK